MKRKIAWKITGVAGAVVSITVLLLLLFLPNTSDYILYDGTTYQAVVNGVLRTDVLELEGIRYYSLDLIWSGIDPYLWLDRDANSITITSVSGMIRLDLGQNEAVIQRGDTYYLKESYLEQVYHTTFPYHKDHRLTIILNPSFSKGEVKADRQTLYVRKDPSIKSPRVKVLQGQQEDLIGNLLEAGVNGWVKVILLTGEVGYIKEQEVQIILRESEKKTSIGINTALPGTEQGIPEFVTKHEEKRINMVWEAVYSENPDVKKIGRMNGLDVIAPTWFELKDSGGTLSNKADPVYVQWAHERGYQVWGTVVSLSDCDLTSSVLRNQNARDRVVRQIMNWVQEYQLDGVNVDFEYMYAEDRMLFTQFMRELSVQCHLQNLPVSCEVTALSTSPKWSQCYDRRSLSDSVDYLCAMLYDQHSGAGGVSGSVAQLSWAEQSLTALLEEIPKEKLILGIPFYTRLWKEESDNSGERTVTSKVLNMQQCQDWILEKQVLPQWDSSSGQYYAEVREGNSLYKLWIENEDSLKKRMELVNQYDLAGCAGWRRGFEKPEIWDLIAQALIMNPNHTPPP